MVVIEDLANDVMAWYARRGDILGLEQFVQTFVKGAVSHANIACSQLLS
jgi:hypothetical protein